MVTSVPQLASSLLLLRAAVQGGHAESRGDRPAAGSES